MMDHKTSPFATAIATVSSFLALVFSTLFFAGLSLASFWVPKRGHLIFYFARWWGRSLLWAGGVRAEVSHRVAYDPDCRYVVMPNHQGFYDIPGLLGSVPFQTRFMAKRSLFQIPIFGWAMKVGGFVPVDRGHSKKAREAFGSAIETLGAGVSILIFPEETRSADGRLLAFRRGGFLLALKSGLPILPVGVSGTGDVRPKGKWTTRPGPISIRFGDPIDVAAYGLKNRRELEAEVRRQILELSGVEDSISPVVDKAEAGKGE